MRWTMALAALLFAGSAQAQDDPLLKPILPDYAQRWMGPQGPVHVYGDVWLVGTAGIDVGLIRTKAGLILIDGAFPQAVPMIEANIRALGFSLKDVKFILSTEPHWDHASGMAALARDSGATVIASAAAAPVLRGAVDPGDPQGALEPYPAPPRIRTVRDGEAIELGGTTIVPRATPGHTSGSMSWTWRACEGGACKAMVFASSLTAVAGTGYRFSDPAHASRVAMFRTTFARMRGLPCDILITAHPEQSGIDKKIAAKDFVDPAACRTYAGAMEKRLDDQIAGEQSSPARGGGMAKP
ncbi:metallo-beta-lactamase class B [Sphingomonas vulcanisoli]|uniref:Metallo-beta-lactamase class B n=1 Tax=Sphingomonas vulcanisoli TaxID=1658060 RepID=A0ABX0TS91_9SPHN|nr:subclass B3 metallo-beta-lactamase [Sphingomonas vulcanisoli]NIJ08331.1 metallo-beta-lactamase class B [Sphingomonas vulcanisoli]